MKTTIEIINEVKEIQLFLEQEPADENIIADFGDKVAVYMARTSMLQADAKYHLDLKFGQHTQNDLSLAKTLSASVFKRYIEAKCAEERRVYEWTQRLNRACTHRLDWCRTRLSFYKTQMNYQ